MNIAFIGLLGVRMLMIQSDTLSNVVVTANRQANKVEFVAAAVTQSKIQKGSINTPEGLTNLPGIFIQRTNQGGGSAFVRGLTGNQTLLLLDGIRFNNSTFRYGPNQYLNTIDPFNLDKAEVLLGSGSVQYGSDALTGAVQLFTLNQEFSNQEKWGGIHSARWGSQGMEKSLLNRISYQSSKLSAFASIGYKSFGDISRGGNNILQKPTGYDETNVLSKIRIKLSENWQIETLIQQNQQKNVPVYHKVQLENFAVNEMSLQRYQRGYVKLKGEFKHPLIQSLELISSIQNSLEDRKLQKNGSSTTRYESDEVNTVGFTAQIKSQFNSIHSAMSGIEIYSDDINSSRKDINPTKTQKLRGLYPDNSQYTSLSAFSLHQWQLNKWAINAGLRYQQSIAALPDTTVGNSTISLGALVYDIGTAYQLNPNNFLFVNYSTGFRAPNMDDLGSLGIVDFRYELPAFQLKPEYSINKTLGLRNKVGNWRSEWVLFHTQLENIITRVKTSEIIQSYSVYKKENIDKAYLYGFEINQTLLISPSFTVKSQISYTYGQNVSQNEPMRRIPPLHGNVGLQYQNAKWNMDVNWLFADRQDRLSAGDKADNRMNSSGTAGWGIINTQISYQINPHIRVNMQGLNLNNVPYRMHGSGIDGVGRSLFMQLNYQW
ncbi:TonB-dependent receptor plug domain-containing protein [Aquirufa sp. ROCK2-A2]